eukprot:CAMPEP_0116149706 /NCGR_PEP_ID=MMETSP0329-20121206/19116_1 /TAXON_ID=697910 /ORGANISM="Pseudo-nitzschia arenysensis, Strain B593" /LENGTH=772 /DNA_ID=CAMNT_0003646089 /DNA_START=144 /DNA_END=2462 /DNA_ORIENTATION=-
MDDKDRPRASPSYFKNVVSLGSDGLPPAPSPRSMSHKSIKSTSSLHRAIQTNEGFGADGETHDNTEHDRLIPLASPTNNFNAGQDLAVRSRKGNGKPRNQSTKRRRKRKQQPNNDDTSNSGCCPNWCFGRCCGGIFWCCNDRKIVRSTLSCMNVVARILSWCTVVASVAGVVWYSYELKKTGKDPHLILWNSAAAFVLIGVPISIYGIVMHLANYNQPETQNYIVRILWMVPIFSIQSWLGLRFKDYSIYFETIRDMYEAYVLYSFLQFLIQVLGGEEALILMLKDKSPTRGVHYGGLQLCLKPWLMGQPLRKTFIEGEAVSSANNTSSAVTASETTISGMVGGQQHLMKQPNKALKRVYWTSPFFLYCKFGVFQYVLLKFLSTIAILLLEPHGLYKEGSFSYKGGYLYICILTNFSQTWALYCFFFFYFATKNELTPIRPVGKFLSVKLLVFFTWWQSLFISILYQMQLIPHYSSAEAKLFGTGGLDDDALDAGGIRTEPDWTVPLSAEDASALDEHGGKAFWSPSADSSAAVEYSPEDVAKALQDYLICIEMFLFAIVHIFVFPHSEYSPEAVDARARALNQRPNKNWNKRLGRKWKEYDNKSAWSGTTNASSRNSEIELYPMNNHTTLMDRGRKDSLDEDDLRHHPMDDVDETEAEHFPLLQEEEENSSESGSYEDDDEFPDHLDDIDENGEEGTSQSPSKSRKKNFFSALLDSSIPQDLRDNAVGIIKGEYVVERKTLLHHAATSDSYDLLSRMSRPKKVNLRTTTKM